MPLPPYIQRADEQADQERYQTVYAEREGAVAAPTAGLHFSEALLRQLDERGIRRATVTLHVGAGTFQPVRARAHRGPRDARRVCGGGRGGVRRGARNPGPGRPGGGGGHHRRAFAGNGQRRTRRDSALSAATPISSSTPATAFAAWTP